MALKTVFCGVQIVLLINEDIRFSPTKGGRGDECLYFYVPDPVSSTVIFMPIECTVQKNNH